MFSDFSLGPACWLWDYLRRSKQVRIVSLCCLGIHIIFYAIGTLHIVALSAVNGK